MLNKTGARPVSPIEGSSVVLRLDSQALSVCSNVNDAVRVADNVTLAYDDIAKLVHLRGIHKTPLRLVHMTSVDAMSDISTQIYGNFSSIAKIFSGGLGCPGFWSSS